jgi:hypothetical protein
MKLAFFTHDKDALLVEMDHRRSADGENGCVWSVDAEVRVECGGTQSYIRVDGGQCAGQGECGWVRAGERDGPVAVGELVDAGEAVVLSRQHPGVR